MGPLRSREFACRWYRPQSDSSRLKSSVLSPFPSSIHHVRPDCFKPYSEHAQLFAACWIASLLDTESRWNGCQLLGNMGLKVKRKCVKQSMHVRDDGSVVNTGYAWEDLAGCWVPVPQYSMACQLRLASRKRSMVLASREVMAV